MSGAYWRRANTRHKHVPGLLKGLNESEKAHFVHVADPLDEVLKGRLVCDVIDKDDTLQTEGRYRTNLPSITQRAHAEITCARL